MNRVISNSPAAFWTDSYGAFRWHSHLRPSKGNQWALISSNIEFDQMRGIPTGKVHLDCVVDDFGNLVPVQ